VSNTRLGVTDVNAPGAETAPADEIVDDVVPAVTEAPRASDPAAAPDTPCVDVAVSEPVDVAVIDAAGAAVTVGASVPVGVGVPVEVAVPVAVDVSTDVARDGDDVTCVGDGSMGLGWPSATLGVGAPSTATSRASNAKNETLRRTTIDDAAP
jgi:hypothetical protein